RVRAHPRAAHLMGAEHADTIGPHATPLDRAREGLEVVALPHVERVGMERDRLARARAEVEARGLDDRTSAETRRQSAHAVAQDRFARAIDEDPAGLAVTDDGDEYRNVCEQHIERELMHRRATLPGQGQE